ncbi:MAG TPA: rhomboid family intramembrane serine protease [Solirubrobacterales bacterium]|nr:rhomboid family intramembrane serine protease [Solirubrobacterales bacterium]
MSETELSVICKNCGSEVSPYVTECPYCGARLRKRAPKLERRGDGLEPKPSRRRPRPRIRLRRGQTSTPAVFRPYATPAAILGSAALLLVLKATGSSIDAYGGLIVPLEDQWWRFLTAPFAYTDVGYLFVIAVGLAIFATALERRLGTAPTALLLLACGSLGMLVASGIANGQGDVEVIAGGNGMALGALAAWFAIRRAEAGRAIDDDYDAIGVIVAAAVLLALPIFESTADPFAGLVGAAVGGLSGLAASALRPSD